METISIKCESCLQIYDVRRTNEIEKDVVCITVNFCCNGCEDFANDYYKETHHKVQVFEKKDTNQLTLKLF